jgi:aspartyl-tRNA(Asn)/glutamyl-tRNA(Gln) amidotransferase subunit A
MAAVTPSTPKPAAEELLGLSIAQLERLYRKREVSPVEVTQAALDRIGRVDPKLNSFVTLTPDLALEQAQGAQNELERGIDRGPLQGVPVAVKDLYATKGIRTTAHSRVLLDSVPDEDATAVAKLYEAGAVLLGKLAMHEFAFGGPASDAAFPPARNPWNTDHVTGGSSSGSGAALAARLCYGSLGSDTGGSIRNPANMCGVAGIKPTYGLVSRYGVVPLSWSLDHCGPLARTVEDCAILLTAIAGHDPRDPASADVPPREYRMGLEQPVRSLKLGIPRAWFHEGNGTDGEILTAFEAALPVLADEGVRLVEVDAGPFMDARAVNTIILISEAYAYHEANIRSRPWDYGSGVLNRLREGALISAADYIQAQRARSVIARKLNDILREVDAIISPAGGRQPEAFAELDPEAAFGVPNYTNVYNCTGLPAMSVPCGFTSKGLPVGLQIAGRAFDEPTVLRLARAYERATSWHTKVPAI